MDIEPYISAIVSAAIFVIGGYFAIRNSTERRFVDIEKHMASQDEKLNQVVAESKASRELTVQIASIATKIDDLRSEVEKHNSVVERTYKLESDMATMVKRHDELRDEVRGLKNSK